MAKPQQYLRATRRGHDLLAMIHDAETPQSKWTKFDSIDKHGWKTEDMPFNPQDGVGKLMSDPTLPDLKSDDDENDAWINSNSHSTHYGQVFNVRGGTIFASDLKSPDASAKANNVDKKDLPDLRHWSDLTFLMWQYHIELKSAPIGCLKRVVHCVISNDDTEAVIGNVMLGSLNKVYPGKTFNPDDGDDFVALLGTPNGMGTAYLLAEHRSQFEGKTVKSIQVFEEVFADDATVKAWYMVLNIG